MPVWKRMAGFTVLPAVAAVSPLLVLPLVARIAGPAGWSSAIASEAIGTFAAIAISYGWGTIGGALVSIAPDDRRRGRLYRDALVIRLLIAAFVIPALAVVCWLIASPGFELLAVLMGLQGALIALSFSWFAVGVGDPRAILVYDAVPRLAAAVAASIAIAFTGVVELYPLSGIAVTVVGTALFSRGLLRRYPATWPALREIPSLFRTGAPVALNDAALGAYSSVPAPAVATMSPVSTAAAFASADKMLKLGQFLPLTLANALQAWVTEVGGRGRSRRLRIALSIHAAMGVAGWAFLAVLGAPASRLLFGDGATAQVDVLIVLGLSFALFSLRTSMTRHVLFPAAQARLVMRASLVGTVVGIPLMLGLTPVFGAIGAAIGFTATELVATLLLVRCTRAEIRRIDADAEQFPEKPAD